ncbi:MAG: hypothetical protein ACR2FN_04800 [Chitinophagaceae bacterium]
MNTNVKLSQTELALVTNADIILTKNEIINKVVQLFGSVCEACKTHVNKTHNNLPEEVKIISPKIYKGEKYLQLPYVMMDYPRFYTKQHVLAIRFFFWWGNFFSISLHLAGKYQTKYLPQIFNEVKKINAENWYLYTADETWKYDFLMNDYMQLFKIDSLLQTEIYKRQFILLSKKVPLELWDEAYDFFTENFIELLQLFS